MQWAVAAHPGEFIYVAGGPVGKGIGESLLAPDLLVCAPQLTEQAQWPLWTS